MEQAFVLLEQDKALKGCDLDSIFDAHKSFMNKMAAKASEMDLQIHDSRKKKRKRPTHLSIVFIVFIISSTVILVTVMRSRREMLIWIKA